MCAVVRTINGGTLENPTLVAPFVLAPATLFGIQNQVHAHSVQNILKVQLKISLA